MFRRSLSCWTGGRAARTVRYHMQHGVRTKTRIVVVVRHVNHRRCVTDSIRKTRLARRRRRSRWKYCAGHGKSAVCADTTSACNDSLINACNGKALGMEKQLLTRVARA